MTKYVNLLITNVEKQSEKDYADRVLDGYYRSNLLQSNITFFISIGFYSFAFALLLVSIILFTQSGETSIITSIISAIGSLMSGGIGTSLMKMFSRIKKESSDNTKVAAKQYDIKKRIEAAKKYISDKTMCDKTISKLLLEEDDSISVNAKVD